MSEKLSRQLRWQLRQIEQGNCRICGKPATFRGYCLDCRVVRREWAREKNGYKRRYNSATYRVMGKRFLLLEVPDLERPVPTTAKSAVQARTVAITADP